MTDLAEIICNVPLFSGLSRADLAKVVGTLEEQTVAAGTKIFSQDDPGDAEQQLAHRAVISDTLEVYRTVISAYPLRALRLCG